MSEISDWHEVTLESVADEITVGYVGPMASEYVSSGIPFLRSTNVQPYSIDLHNVIYIGESFHHQIRKSALSPGDVVVVRTGKPGTAAVIPESLPVANCADLVIIRPSQSLDSRFLAYYINSAAQGRIAAYLVGAVQQHFNIGSAKQLKLRLPPVSEQRAIGRILGGLDDQIELNRRINHTLESMTQALFKSWFVDFDPVTAKSEGRAPFGMSAETAALFPAEFIDSELGAIPRGWEATTLGKVLDITKGRSYASSELSDSETALATLKSINRGGGYRRDGLKPFTGKYKPEQVLKPGGLIIACTDITQNADVVGRPAMIPHQSQFKTLVASLDLWILRPNQPDVSIPFLYNLLRTDDYVNHIIGYASGTTVLHLSKDGVLNYEFARPPIPVLHAFDKVAEPISERLVSLESESSELETVRDALLPRLLSGEVRVKV